MESFEKSGRHVDTLTELNKVIRKLDSLKREAQRKSDFTILNSDIKEKIEQCNIKRTQLINIFDQSFRTKAHNEKAFIYSETPGELCNRLIDLTLMLDNEILVQNDVSVPNDERILSLNKVAHLRTLRSHLQQCLKQLITDIEEGNPLLPALSEFRKYDNPYVDPVTRKEVSINLYSYAEKATKLNKKINHILGIACNGHGASLAYIDRDGSIRSSVLDRWAGTKYTLMVSKGELEEMVNRRSAIAAEMYDLLAFSYGAFPKYKVFESAFPAWMDWLLSDLDLKAEDIDLLISSESNFVTSTFRLGPQLNQWLPNAHIVTDLEHHTVHQCQAFWQSGFKEAAVLTLDTGGENLTRLNNHKICGTISRMDRSSRCQVLREFIFPHSSAGLIYSIINHHLGFSQGQEGKTMGLAPYGRPDLYQKLANYLRLYPDGSFDFLPYTELHMALENYEYQRPKEKGAEFTQKHCDIACAGQAIIEDIVVNAFKAALRLTGLKNLVYAGGLALNSVANEIANRVAKPDKLYIPPNPGDTGQALGCALYAAYELAGWPPQKTEIPEYLGPQYNRDKMLKAIHSTDHYRIQLENPEWIIACCIANGHIVARFAGQAEFGPRALGNRSILADPRRNDMKEYLNARVKHRESYRPFAPSVLIEYASKWFDLGNRSPYMLRVVNVPANIREYIPAVVHVDGSARVQSVDKRENPEYWKLIDSFYKITDVPLVLNTSFNVAGKPIVETPQDAVDCFESTDIDVLLIEDWIISKRPIEEFEKVSR
jgi:carbamoyltransferase